MNRIQSLIATVVFTCAVDNTTEMSYQSRDTIPESALTEDEGILSGAYYPVSPGSFCGGYTPVRGASGENQKMCEAVRNLSFGSLLITNKYFY